MKLNTGKKALLIAFHFPPIRHSSGIQRTLKFMNYLRECDWEPMILSAHPRAYESTGSDLLKEIPDDIIIERAFALDTARHLAIKGRYLDVMSRPDRYGSWWLGGVWSGLRMIRKHRPDIIWSTSPIPTAQKIGHTLHRLTGIPWVSDLRDPITEPEYPADPKRRARLRTLEDRIVKSASKVVVTTQGTLDMYKQRYPNAPEALWGIISNGYDEQNFLDAEQRLSDRNPVPNRPMTLVHAGILYPEERDPRAFFAALSRLKKNKIISASKLQIILRGTCNDEIFTPMLENLEIEDIVLLEPAIAYEEALLEMLNVDGLLLFQATICNHQVPAKMYEYFRAQKPIFALTDASGNTASILQKEGINTIVSLTNTDEIEQGLQHFLKLMKGNTAPKMTLEQAVPYSRRAGAEQLASIFEDLVYNT